MEMQNRLQKEVYRENHKWKNQKYMLRKLY